MSDAPQRTAISIPRVVGKPAPRLAEQTLEFTTEKVPGKIEWLVEGMIPDRGGVIRPPANRDDNRAELLDLAIKIATPPPGYDASPPMVRGRKIVRHGRVVILSAEDSKDEIHRRTHDLFPDLTPEIADRIHLVSYQDRLLQDRLERSQVLFDWQNAGRYLSPTQEFLDLQGELRILDDLALVILHPLWSFVVNAPSRRDSESFSVLEEKILKRLNHLAHSLGCGVVGYRE